MISEALTKLYQARPERKTHGGLHISDVANGCPRAVWHRIHRGADRSFDALTLKKMRYGLRYEPDVREAALLEGYTVLADEVAILCPNGEKLHVPTLAYDDEPTKYAGVDDLVGHPDLVLERDGELLVVEIKTTMLFRSGYNAPAHPPQDQLYSKSGNYILQGAAYAYAFDAPTFIVHVSDRGTGIDVDYTFATAEYWPLFERRWEVMRAALNPDSEPAASPPEWTFNTKGTSYLCKQCVVSSCASNQQKKAS